MKKTLALLLAAAAIAALFVGFSKSPVGVYKSETVNGKAPYDYMVEEFNGDADSLDQLIALIGKTKEDVNNYVIITLEKDGTAKLSTFLDEGEEIGTWKQDGRTITMTGEDGESREFTYDGSRLIGKLGENEIVLSKQK